MEEKQFPEQTKIELVSSKDGSSTLWAPDFDEHYHSIHGALTESLHVFIEAALSHRLASSKESLSVFEMGFGTGLNALLTYFDKDRGPIRYTSIEKYPIGRDLWSALNYAELLEEEKAGEVFARIHEADWEEWTEIGESDFLLKKQQADLLDFQPEEEFDLIYFDAFAPSSQSYLWGPDIMNKLYSWSKPQAVFTTYSAKGDVRRALLAAGFEVEKIPGPPGKREMLRAHKN